MSAPKPTDSRALLEHAAWVRALAHSLVADPALADDLAQDTCVAALEHPPATAVQPRGWLRAVLVNFARQAARSGVRRRAREEWAARPEAEADALEVLARAAAHRALVEAVMSLAEPFRTAILLRFFDELPPRRIARLLGVPLATVHSRLQRGLAQLRASLDERAHGDRGAWVSALLPLARQAGPSFPLSLGALAMSAKWKLTVVIALVLCGGWSVWRSVQPRLAPEREAPAVARAEDAPAGPSARRGAAREPAPEEEAQRVSLAPDAAARVAEREPPPAALLRGRVLDAEARPVRGIEVVFQPTSAGAAAAERFRARSEGGGAFAMPAPAGEGELLVHDDAYATVMAGTFKPGSSIEPVVVVASQRDLAGHVRDEDGLALSGARVELELAADFGARFAQVLDASHPVRLWSETDASGAFALARAPVVGGSRLVTALSGYRSDVRPAPEYAERALEIVLVRERVEARALRGMVVAPDGGPVRDAHVALGTLHVLSDADGSFAFDLSQDEEHAERLVAVKRGYLPAEARAEPDAPGAAPRWPDSVLLRLGGAPARLAGRVVDEKGEPVAHARVWLADPTFFGLVEDAPAQLEHLLAGAASPAELERRMADAGSGAAEIALNTPNLLWNWAEADARGEFELGGLLPRSYALRVMDPATLVHAELGPFTAGSTDLELVLRLSDVYARVAGRVLTSTGLPVAGVRVTSERTVVRVAVKLAHGEQSSSMGWPSSRTTLTDAEGRFELARIPKEGVFLGFGSDAIVPTTHDLDRGEDVEALQISVTLRCHAQIELDERSARADAFSILDQDGNTMDIFKFRGRDEYASSSFPLAGGRSEVFALAEGARTVVLYREGQEVARHEIALRPGELNWLRF